MKFIPDDDPRKASSVPMLEKARAEDGWQGHQSSASIATLRAQITNEIAQLGGSVTRFQTGDYLIEGQKRVGLAIEYQLATIDGRAFTGRIDVAGLPFLEPYSGRTSHGGYKRALAKKRDQALRMALVNARAALKSARILQILSPGFSPLIPYLLVQQSNKTFGQLWAEGMGQPALPAPAPDGGDVVDADFREV